jgi:hypothetical protein
MALDVEASAKEHRESVDYLGGFRCLPLGTGTAQRFAGQFCEYGFYRTTLSEAARAEITDCVSETALDKKTAWGVTRWEAQWFQKQGSWWNPRHAKTAELTSSAELGAIATRFCKENIEGLRSMFECAPTPYNTIYGDGRLLGHVCAQYFNAAEELIADNTRHRDGEECFFGMCVSIGGLRRTFHIQEGGSNALECDQKNGDVYFTSFSLSSHALSRRAGTVDERDTVVIFRPLVSETEAREMAADLRALSAQKQTKTTQRQRFQLRDGVVDFYRRLAQFILDGPLPP